jgi:hypothetical protein
MTQTEVVEHAGVPKPSTFWNGAPESRARQRRSVNAYKAQLEEAHLSASTINVRFAAVRRLVKAR